jgi:hypothetical protein
MAEVERNDRLAAIDALATLAMPAVADKLPRRTITGSP